MIQIFYILLLYFLTQIFNFLTSTVSVEWLYNVLFFSPRDLKPENILLDDRGMFTFFSFFFLFDLSQSGLICGNTFWPENMTRFSLFF